MFGVFFQAEDGIRDLVRSRGLGDVYKRQAQAGDPSGTGISGPGFEYRNEISDTLNFDEAYMAVSYTHLTLPTIYSV